MTDHVDRSYVRWLEWRLSELDQEVRRLRAGKFTEEELQALCHEQGEDCPARFSRGCIEYNLRLFGNRSLLTIELLELSLAHQRISQLTHAPGFPPEKAPPAGGGE